MDSLTEVAPQGRSVACGGHLAIRPEPPGLSAARHTMVAVARELAFDDGETMDILIAVGEALSNAYRHGTLDPVSGLIYLGWRFAGDVLTVTVRDEGPGFISRGDRASVTGGLAAGGHGISLMCRSMDEVEFGSEDGARVVLRKRLRVRASPGSAADSES